MTKLSVSAEQLAALGLAGVSLEEEELALWPATPVAEGKGVKEAAAVGVTLASLASGAASHLLLPLALRSLHSAGTLMEYVQEKRHLIRLTPAEGNRVALLGTAQPSEDAYGYAQDVPGALCLDTQKTGPVLLEMPDGTRLLIRVSSDGVSVARLPTRPLEIEPLAILSAPDWLASCADTWLRGEILARLELRDAWENAVAVGMYARLPEVSATRARQAILDLLAGKPDEELARPRIWARGLDGAQKETLEDLSLAEVGFLNSRLQGLEEDGSAAEAGWREELRHLCLGRDDVEGVRLLLAEANAGERLAPALNLLDEAAGLFVDSLPARVRLHDERLRRVAQSDPTAWWARLAELTKRA